MEDCWQAVVVRRLLGPECKKSERIMAKLLYVTHQFVSGFGLLLGTHLARHVTKDTVRSSIMENKSSSPRTKPPKTYSCVRCFERKVKCDKQHPCSACLRSNVDCIFRARAAPRRPPRQVADEAVLARLKYYEDLLRENGIDLASPSATLSEAETTSPPHDAHHFTGLKSNKPLFNPNLSHGKFIVDNGKSRFIEKYASCLLR